jgi:hypothetical protein
VVFEGSYGVELTVLLAGRIEAMVGERDAHHLEMLHDHLINMLIAVGLSC